MGVSILIARWIGRKFGSAFAVPVKDGVMFPYVYKYADKIADLKTETHIVNKEYLSNLIEEAYNKHDLAGLRAIHKYYMKCMSGKADDTELLNRIIHHAKELKLHESVGDPFALFDHIEKVVHHLC